jgi:hypothetical protein
MKVFWNSAAPGYFDDGSKWSSGSAPGSLDLAFMNPTGTPYTVTVRNSETRVLGVSTSADATLTSPTLPFLRQQKERPRV